MKAELLFRERQQVAERAFVDIRLWRIPHPLPGSTHRYKYALAYVVAGECVLRCDNEAGNGDHRHYGNQEFAYRITSPRQLLADFWSDVDRWRKR